MAMDFLAPAEQDRTLRDQGESAMQASLAKGSPPPIHKAEPAAQGEGWRQSNRPQLSSARRSNPRPRNFADSLPPTSHQNTTSCHVTVRVSKSEPRSVVTPVLYASLTDC